MFLVALKYCERLDSNPHIDLIDGCKPRRLRFLEFFLDKVLFRWKIRLESSVDYKKPRSIFV